MWMWEKDLKDGSHSFQEAEHMEVSISSENTGKYGDILCHKYMGKLYNYVIENEDY